jgi:hypothetical protein
MITEQEYCAVLSVLGTEDMYDLLEIISVDMYNQYVVNKASRPV